jgi:hypothetical protein
MEDDYIMAPSEKRPVRTILGAVLAAIAIATGSALITYRLDRRSSDIYPEGLGFYREEVVSIAVKRIWAPKELTALAKGIDNFDRVKTYAELSGRLDKAGIKDGWYIVESTMTRRDGSTFESVDVQTIRPDRFERDIAALQSLGYHRAFVPSVDYSEAKHEPLDGKTALEGLEEIGDRKRNGREPF